MCSTMFNYLSEKINIYCISLEQKAQDDFINYLSPDDIARAFNFIQTKHQRRYIICQGILRLILSEHLNIKPQAVKFRYGKYGKPYLDHDTNITFNVSHSHEMALIAVTQNQEIGIDIEYHSNRPMDGIAEKMFSPAEIARVQQALHNKTQVFYEIWTGKEAFIKAIGMGLRYPTQNITIPELKYKPKKLYENNNLWLIKKINLDGTNEYSAALCSQQHCDYDLHLI